MTNYSTRCAICGKEARPWWDSGQFDCQCDTNGRTIRHVDEALMGTYYMTPKDPRPIVDKEAKA